MTSKVSFYIPCFNAAKTIGPCLDAVFKQEYPAVEVIVVDDGSTDESARIVSRYPVRLLSHANNLGLAAARNTAIKSATGDFIASMDADCCPQTNWLGLLMSKLSSPEIAAAGGKLLEGNSKTVFDEWRSVRMRQNWDGLNTSPPFLFGSNTVFRKEALVNIGYYRECYKNNYEDVDISTRLISAGYVLAYEPQAIAHHLRNDNIASLFDTYWKWNFDFYQKDGFYSSLDNFMSKAKDTVGLVNRYMEEDIVFNRTRLLYLDFLLFFYQSLKDLYYFSFSDSRYSAFGDMDILSVRLSLLDLVFFYHWDFENSDFTTLIPAKDAFLQNFFALNLVLGRAIRSRFPDRNFMTTLYKHLLLLFCNFEDPVLPGKIVNLIESHSDWSGLYKKYQLNLNSLFLSNLSLYFYRWFEDMVERNPGIIQMLELSANQTQEACVFMQKGGLC